MSRPPQTLPAPRFAFHAHKPKARALGEWFVEGCRKRGYDAVLAEGPMPYPGRIGVFYGVVPETYGAFLHYRADGRAVYLDNGWLSTPEAPTFRFAWNGVQSFLRNMRPVARLEGFAPLPEIDRRHRQDDLALLILQSPDYFTNLRLGISRDRWQSVITRLLTDRGFRVETREKPTKRSPEADTFFDQMARAGIVVSLNSAATVKALRYGIPAYCTLDCTLSPYAPVRLPKRGHAAAPSRAEVAALCRSLAAYELTKSQLTSGGAVDRILGVSQPERSGYWYGPA